MKKLKQIFIIALFTLCITGITFSSMNTSEAATDKIIKQSYYKNGYIYVKIKNGESYTTPKLKGVIYQDTNKRYYKDERSKKFRTYFNIPKLKPKQTKILKVKKISKKQYKMLDEDHVRITSNKIGFGTWRSPIIFLR